MNASNILTDEKTGEFSYSYSHQNFTSQNLIDPNSVIKNESSPFNLLNNKSIIKNSSDSSINNTGHVIELLSSQLVKNVAENNSDFTLSRLSGKNHKGEESSKMSEFNSSQSNQCGSNQSRSHKVHQIFRDMKERRESIDSEINFKQAKPSGLIFKKQVTNQTVLNKVLKMNPINDISSPDDMYMPSSLFISPQKKISHTLTVNAFRIRESVERRRAYRMKVHELNTFAITDMLKKSEDNSMYAKTAKALRWLDFSVAVIILCNIVLSIIDNEVSLGYSDEFFQNIQNEHAADYILTLDDLQSISTREVFPIEHILRILNGLLSLSAAMFIMMRYNKEVEFHKINSRFCKYDNISSSGLWKYMAIDMIMCLIFYPPFLPNLVISEVSLGLIFVYSWSSIISIFVLFKTYLVLRIFNYFSRWTTDTAVALLNNYNVKPDIHFAIKAEMKKRPATVLSLLLIISLALLAFSIRTFEYKVFDPVKGYVGVKGSNDLQNLANCFWLIIVTMTTVGYGDFYPRSHFGRLVGVIACIVGLFLLSLIVVFLGSFSEFSFEEKKAFSRLKKLFAHDNLENKAANVIKSLMQLKRLKMDSHGRSLRGNLMQRFVYLTALKKEIAIFKNDDKVANSHSLPVDEMLVQLENKLNEDIYKLTGILEKLRDTDKDLDLIGLEQGAIQDSINDVISMQDDIAKYMINLNNEKYKGNLFKKKAEEELENKGRKRSVLVFDTCKSGRKISNINPIIKNSKILQFREINSHSKNDKSLSLKFQFNDKPIEQTNSDEQRKSHIRFSNKTKSENVLRPIVPILKFKNALDEI